MKKQDALMMMTMMAMANDGFRQNIFEEEKSKKQKPFKKEIPKGLTEFFYGENKVIALNKKNADRKAKKQGFFICAVATSVFDG